MGRDEEQMPEFMTIGEVADLLRVDVRTVYAAVQRGELPAARIGRQYRISREALQEWAGRSATREDREYAALR
jgi:excisionase family DNA binding protein